MIVWLDVMKVTFRDTSATQYDANADLIILKGNNNDGIGKLYLGDRYSGSFLQLKHRQCKFVISCDKEIHSLSREEDVNYLNIDPANENFEDLEKAYDFIENTINKGKNVTVLCQTGYGKSAAVVVYYVMRKYSLNPFEAIEYVKKYHQKVRINPTITSFICREAKKLGLMITSDQKKPGRNWSRSGLYFILFAAIFFGLIYFGLVLLTPASNSTSSTKTSTRANPKVKSNTRSAPKAKSNQGKTRSRSPRS